MSHLIIRDPLYDYISIEKGSIIHELIDTSEFQRLRYVRQLGLSYLTYPSAIHTRFNHSLGTFHVSKRLCSLIEIPDDESMKIQIAALLHDIGHMGLSHVLESTFFTRKHEGWSRDIINSSVSHVNEILSRNYTPSEISKKLIQGPSHPKYYHDIISSQIDVDRFDYLRRDSYFTGNPSGFFDLERMLRVLKPIDAQLCVDYSRGKYVLEHYIHSRYYMYSVVYNHRVTIGLENFLKKIFERARTVNDSEVLSPDSPVIPLIAERPIKLEEYLRITDFEIFSAISNWRNSGDGILSNLCSRFLDRDFPKPVKMDKPIKVKDYEENEDEIAEVLEFYEYEPEYYLMLDTGMTKKAYIPYDVEDEEEQREDAIFFDDGTEITSKIGRLKALNIERKAELYAPKRTHDRIRRILVGERGG